VRLRGCEGSEGPTGARAAVCAVGRRAGEGGLCGVARSQVNPRAMPKPAAIDEKDGDRDVEKGSKGMAPPARVYRYPEYPVDRHYLSGCVPPPPYYVRRIGRMYVLREKVDENGIPTPQMVVGPCWPMIFMVTTLIVGTTMAVFFGVYFEIEPWMGICTLILMLFVVSAYLCTSCSNPGIWRIHDEPSDPTWTFSNQAQSYRPPNVMYDQETQTMFKNIDHFCPWTGTMIAGGNIKPFYAFVSSLCLLIFVVIGLGVYASV